MRVIGPFIKAFEDILPSLHQSTVCVCVCVCVCGETASSDFSLSSWGLADKTPCTVY